MASLLRAAAAAFPAVFGVIGGCNAVAGLDGLAFRGAGGGGADATSAGETASVAASSSSSTSAECDPALGPPAASCGVFVSGLLGHGDGVGTPDDPVRRLSQALELAAAGGQAIYACAESFEENLVIDTAVVLFGGLDCNKGWVGTVAGRTAIAPKNPGIPIVVNATASGTFLDALHLQAPAAKQAGESSIGLLVEGASVELSRSEVDVLAGADGADASVPLGSADGGQSGDFGIDACPAVASALGAPGPSLVCPDGTTTAGGAGGDASALAGPSKGSDGAPAYSDATGLGGAAQPIAGQGKCVDGTTGAPGANGTDGASATGLGTLTSSGVAGLDGQAGTPGLPGQGGGGGGATRSTSADCGLGTQTVAGASGGAGGTGGCGGEGAPGGQAGGASLAIVSLGANLTLSEVTLSVGAGGHGGDGAAGRPGGSGASGGAGGQGASFMTDACAGGTGGLGGTGGASGGGVGGHSIGVAFAGAEPSGDFTVNLGVPGIGGVGGTPGLDGGGRPAANGVAANTLAF